jgi:hypothetical protein
MGWMKLVANMQENNTLTLLKAALDKAIEYNLKYVHFDGEILTTDKARAIVTLLKTKQNDQVHRESDTITNDVSEQ